MSQKIYQQDAVILLTSEHIAKICCSLLLESFIILLEKSDFEVILGHSEHC